MTKDVKKHRLEDLTKAVRLQVAYNPRASARDRLTAVRDLEERKFGRVTTAKPVVTIVGLTQPQRSDIIQELLAYYPEEIGLGRDAMIAQVVAQVADEVERRAAKLAFRRGKPALPLPSPAHIQKDAPSGREDEESGASPHHAAVESPSSTSAPARPPYGDPPSLRNEADEPANALRNAFDDRSHRLAELAAGFLPRDKRAPLAADSGDGMAHALALSRLSADQLQDRYFSRFRFTSDTDPTIWRGKR